ncbi:MAG: hypothetical protein ASARMPREDX12_004774 [Alectoria sarmentosa]|nr:MAG: hypothetical protein ASARMPREDX12_004774 [Alectoria sarmentosa]
MADPFSIIVGTVGLADVCIRLTKFLKEAKDGFQKIDEDLEGLSREIIALRTVSDLIKHSFEVDLVGTTNPSDNQVVVDLWKVIRTNLEGCQDIVERLNALIITVLGTEGHKHARFNNLRKYLKQQSKDDEFSALRRKLNAYHIALQTSLAAVNVIYTRNSQSTSNESFSELSQKIQHLGGDLQAKIVSLQADIKSSAERNLDNAVRSAQNVVPLASLNKHFYTPQTVSSIFTGRATDLDTLRRCLQASASTSHPHIQKRFVVYGLPGSGKTQFCCKFASDNKQTFWGVFWIDASSNEHARQSFSTIARIGRVEPNERAAKNWLSSLGKEQPWLLIIDNADEISFPVEECYPDGDCGIILITTRNPILKVHGTIGPRYYEFAELKDTESIELLLRAADAPLPWSPSTQESAKDICRTLGYLPLALMHAGKTILARQCTLENYPSFFEKNWTRIRRIKSSNDARPVSDANAAIYSSYELIHDGIVAKGTQASEDALDLLKVFSFLHRQRIRADIFLRAASNPRLEILEQKRRDHEENEVSIGTRPSVPWAHKFRTFGFGVLAFLLKLGYRPVLPRMLSDALESRRFDDLRLREALKELFQMSLVFANPDPKDDSYSMHPAVHLWVRERPEMKIADQAVWCQVTATILTQAILLPPLGDKEEDEIFRRDLLPHVRHVQENEQTIRTSFLENQESRRRMWPAIQPRLDRGRALQLVKFSLVYSQCGLFEAAEKLQIQVADFATKMLGIEHTITMDILLLLSSTYWQLTRIQEAADLQQRVLEACINVRGKNDLKTLKIMDAYGSSQWQQGRIPEARKIHETAVEGFKKVLGDNHVDTLRAMGNLGRAVGKDFRFTEAVKIHSKVVSGLRDKLGHSHLDTLIAMDNLAMAYFDRAAYGYGRRGDLDHAVDMEQEVFEQRKEKLGREHLYTLWAGLNLARIKALRGEIDEALSIFLPGHAIARRNLGETHFGILFAKMHHGRILIYAKKYKEAEDILLEVIESHRGLRKGHPDRLLAIFSLIKCRNLLGKQAETVVLLKELTESTKALFGDDHPWVRYLLDPWNLSKEPDEDNSSPIDSMHNTPGSTSPIEKLMPVAMIAKYGHI